jgi:serine phosphatase RsbU (regulator of sigma subunit)
MLSARAQIYAFVKRLLSGSLARHYAGRMGRTEDDLRTALGRALDAVEDASPVGAVEAVTHEVGAILGATSVSFLVADLSGRGLVRLTHDSPAGTARAPDAAPRDGGTDARRDVHELATSVPFDGGPAERALRTQAVQVLPPRDQPAGTDEPVGRWTVLAPVVERGEALGVLELCLPSEPAQAVVAELARLAHLLGFVVVASRRHTDLYEWGQRSTPFSLSAEIQRRLLPAGYTCEGGSFTLSAWLEPADDVGGDTFDYSLARDVLHMSISDAMGHGVDSALTATLCVGSLRNTRRHGMPLLDQACTANAALFEHNARVSVDGFSTGLVGRVDLQTGVLTLVNAGHVAPYLLRARAAKLVELPPDLPFGMFADTTYVSTEIALRPGDRVVFVTDGMLERNATNLDLPALISTTGGMHPREATRRLADLVLDATGQSLADDATLMIVDWHGHHGNGRDTVSGATLGSSA